MISANDLRRCIEILAELNVLAESHKSKTLILEVGFILKQELDKVGEFESSYKSNKLDAKKLLEDNTALFNENKRLHDLNMKLKEIVNQRIPKIESTITEVNGKIDMISERVNEL